MLLLFERAADNLFLRRRISESWAYGVEKRWVRVGGQQRVDLVVFRTFSFSKFSSFLFSDWRVFIVTAAGEEGGSLGAGGSGGLVGVEDSAAKSTSSSPSLSLKVKEDEEARAEDRAEESVGLLWASSDSDRGVEPGEESPSNFALRCLARSSFAANSPPAGIFWQAYRENCRAPTVHRFYLFVGRCCVF